MNLYPYSRYPLFGIFGSSLVVFILCLCAQLSSAASPDSPARVVITDSVVASNPQPFGLNQLNSRWGLNNVGYDNESNGYEPTIIRDRWFVSEFGTTHDGRGWFGDGSFRSTNRGDGFWDGATIRIYRATVQADGVTTYQRVGLSTVQDSMIDRGFWSVSFGINDSLKAVDPNSSSNSISFRNVLPANARSYADGQKHQFYQMTDLEDGATYYYTVQSVDAGGNWSANSSVVSAVPSDAQRSGPRIVTHQIGSIQVGDMNKSFLINVTNGVGELTFSIVGDLPGSLEGAPVMSAERQAYRIKLPKCVRATELEASNTSFRLRVEDANGAWDERDIMINPVPPVLISGDVTAPAPPVNVQAKALDGGVYVTWDASPDADVIGYRVLRSRFAPVDQLGRIELADAFSFQPGDLVFADKEFSRLKGHPELYHERTYFRPFETDPLWPQWRIDGQGGWRDWRNSYNNGYHADFDFDFVAAPTPIPAAFEDVGSQVVRVTVPPLWQYKLMLGKLSYKQDADDLYYRVIEPGKTYHLKAWIRQENVPDGLITLQINGNTYSRSLERTINIPDSEWTEIHITDWSIPEFDQNRSVDRVDLLISGGADASTVWFDHVEIYEYSDEDGNGSMDTEPGRMSEFWKGELADFFQLPKANASRPTLRYWGLQSNGKGGVAFSDLIKPRLAQRGSRGQGDGENLPDFLELAHEVNAVPWLILSVSMTEEEWADVLEYLAGDANTTYGAQRIEDRGGITTPWTDEFERILIEVDNETWNSMFAWTFYGASDAPNAAVAYGRYAEMLIRAMKNSPIWQADPTGLDAKIDFVVNGQNSGQNYGKDAAIAAPSAEIADLAPYLGGWESNSYIGGTTLTDEGFQDWMLFAPWKHYNEVNGHVNRLREASLLRPQPYRLGVYEGGPGYDLPNASNPSGVVAESYGKSLAAAVTTLDSYLFESYRGYDAQAFFGFAVGSRWTTHAFSHDAVDQPLTYVPQATWLAQKLRNNFISGSMVETYMETVPTIDLPAEAGQEAAPGTPLIASYAFQDGDRYSVLLLSRKIDSRDAPGNVTDPAITPVELVLPFTQAQSVSLHRLTGDPRSTNVPSLPNFDPANLLEIESIPLDASSVSQGRFVVSPETGGVVNQDGTVLGMPPGSIYLYVFDGVQAPSKPTAPQAKISRAPQQDLSSFERSVTFRVAFDRPVVGFDRSDLDFSASSVDLSKATVLVSALDPMLDFPLVYEVVVSGEISGGTLEFDLPAGSVTSLADGIGNIFVDGSASVVELIASSSTVHFNASHANPVVLGSLLRVSSARQTQGTPIEKDVWMSLDLSSPIFPDVGEQPIYGGIRATANGGSNKSGNSVLPSVMLAIAANSTVYPEATFAGYYTSGKDAAGKGLNIDTWSVFLWKKEDFSHIDQTAPLALNAGSRLSLGIEQWQGSQRRFHFVIKDKDTYYLSEMSYAGELEFQLSEFVSNTDKRWAPIDFTEDTNDFSTLLDDLSALAFAEQSFSDVQAVGFAARVSSSYYRRRGFQTFGLDIVNDPNPYLARELSSSLSTVTGDKVTLSVAAIDADTRTLAYTWKVIQQPLNANIDLGSGAASNVPAGELATNTITFDKSGLYIFRVAISDGTQVIESNEVTVTVNGDFTKDSLVPNLITR